LSTTLDEFEPASFTEASRYPHWKQAMAEEYNALMTNGTLGVGPS